MPMTIRQMDVVRAEIARFLTAAAQAEAVLRDDWHRTNPDLRASQCTSSLHEHALIVGTRETAAVRRASLDLTRALADLRRGR